MGNETVVHGPTLQDKRRNSLQDKDSLQDDSLQGDSLQDTIQFAR